MVRFHCSQPYVGNDKFSMKSNVHQLFATGVQNGEKRITCRTKSSEEVVEDR
jgi:hypothetical protein